MISRIISYFYEHFISVKFKLFTRTTKWRNEFRGNCYFSTKKFPLIKQILQTSTTTQHVIDTPCDEEELIRTFTINSTHYVVTFPRYKITNEVPELKNVQQYVEQIKHDYVLDFQWSNPTDTGYSLEIEVGEKLNYIPKTWWIHQQSDSLLGYHYNFFLPNYFKTLQTTYSYARDNRHYFAEGFYVKKPGITYLRQKVVEHTPHITSWPIPTQKINIKHPPSVYFKPHLGNLETLLPKALNLLQRPPRIDPILQCTNYTQTFRTIRQERFNYHQTISNYETSLLPELYSYDQPDHHQRDKKINNIQQGNLQRRIDDKSQLFHVLWINVRPHILNLQENLLSHYFTNNEKMRLKAEQRLYMTFFHQQTWLNSQISKARLKERRAYNQLLHECNYLSAIISPMHQRFREIYAMTLQHRAIQILRNSKNLQPYILYQHIITSAFINSYPLKFNPSRMITPQIQPSILTPFTNIPTRTSNSPQSTVQSSTPQRNTSNPFAPTFTEVFLQKQQPHLRKPKQRSSNQHYMLLPWKLHTISDTREYSLQNNPMMQFIKRQIHRILYKIQQTRIAAKNFLEKVFLIRINCDT